MRHAAGGVKRFRGMATEGKPMTSATHSGPPLLRQINSARVLTVLRASGLVSLSDLAARTGLSRPTIGQVVDQLHTAGLLAYAEPGQAGLGRSGRPARLVRFRAEAAYVVGIDIGRHKIGVMVADLAGHVVARHRRAISAANSSKDLLGALRQTVREALAEAGIRRGDVASVARRRAANFDKDCAHDAMLVPRSKQAILGNSRAKIHVQLTMRIISQNIGLGQNCEEKNTGAVGDPDTLLQ